MTSGEKMIWAAEFVRILGHEGNATTAADAAWGAVTVARNGLDGVSEAFGEDSDIYLFLDAMLHDD